VSEEPLLSTAREAVAAACRRLARAGLVAHTNGNVSMRAGERVAITPTGAVLGELEAAQVAVVDEHGKAEAGAPAPTSELALHLGVYRRYHAGAVVHTHSPAATALSLVVDELPCIHYEMLALGGAVRVAPYRAFGTPELAAVVLDALEGRTAALMSNHGALAHGPDLAAAVGAAELLERACDIYWRAAAIGTPRALDAAEREAVAGAVRARGYGATPRRDPGAPP
jgi:L-fuculose-phosphate aldolase